MNFNSVITSNNLSALFSQFLSERLQESERVEAFIRASTYNLHLEPFDTLFTKISEFLSKEGSYPSSRYLSTIFPDMSTLLLQWSSATPVTQDEFNDILHRSQEESMQHITQLVLATASKANSMEGSAAARRYILENLPTSAGHTLSMKNVSLRERYIERLKHSEGPMFFIKQLDAVCHAIKRGKFVTVGAFTSQLKTTYAVNFLYNNTVAMGFNGCLITSEMTSEEMHNRLLVRHANSGKFAASGFDITWHKYDNGLLSPDEMDFIFTDVEEDLKSSEYGTIFVRDQSEIDFSIESMQEELVRISKMCDGGLHFVIFDYIQRIAKSEASSKYSFTQLVTMLAKWMKDLALTFLGEGIVVVGLSQFSREKFLDAQRDLEKRKFTYDLTAFSESSEIEKSSDMALSIFFDKDQKKLCEALFQLLKNRGGITIEEPFKVLAKPGSMYVGDFIVNKPTSELISSLISRNLLG